MTEDRKVANPTYELGVDAIELLFWQLGAAGLGVPKAVIFMVPAPPLEQPKLLYGAFAWDPTIYQNVQGTFPWFTYSQPAAGGGNDVQFSFTDVVPDETGGNAPLEFVLGLARVCGSPTAALPTTRRRFAVTLSDPQTINVTCSSSDADNVLQPLGLLLW